jgi:hypothetical protein
MKKILVLATAFLFMSTCIMAQNDSIRNNRKALKKEMAKEAGISKEQGKQAKQINNDFKGQMKAIRNDATLTDEQKKEKIRTLNQERRTKIQAVFTPDQQAKMKAFRDKHPEMKNPHHHKMKSNNPAKNS